MYETETDVWSDVDAIETFMPSPPAPVVRDFFVSIGTVNPTRGFAWVLTPSHRPGQLGNWFAPNTRVEIAASPSPGFVFSHWTLINLSTGNIATDRRAALAFAIRGHMVIEAHFLQQQPVRPPVPPRPPVRPVPPIAPAPRPPVRPPSGVMPRPPVRPVPPIGILPISMQDEDIDTLQI